MSKPIIVNPKPVISYDQSIISSVPPFIRRTLEEAGNGMDRTALFRFQRSGSAFRLGFRKGLVETPKHSEINMVFYQPEGQQFSEQQVRNNQFLVLQDHFWFLNPYWFEKQNASYVLRFSSENTVSDLVCYASEGIAKLSNLSEKLSAVFEFVSTASEVEEHTKGLSALSKVRYVLVDDQEFRLMRSPKRPYANGCYPIALGSIKELQYNGGIYLTKSPLVRNKYHGMHVPRVEASIIHELAHVLATVRLSIIDIWKHRFGWSEDKNGKPRCAQPARCITEYQRTAPEEDFADSVVQFYFGLRGFDSEKREFLDSIFSRGRVKVRHSELEPGQEGLTYTIRYEVRQQGA